MMRLAKVLSDTGITIGIFVALCLVLMIVGGFVIYFALGTWLAVSDTDRGDSPAVLGAIGIVIGLALLFRIHTQMTTVKNSDLRSLTILGSYIVIWVSLSQYTCALGNCIPGTTA